MTDAGGKTRTPAASLWVTFRSDGALLLELLADWYTMLGIAESHVEDPEGSAAVLRSWAQGPRVEEPSRHYHGPGLRRSDFAEFQHAYSRGVPVAFVGAEQRDRSAMGGFYRDAELFVEVFGSQSPADERRLERFVVRLTGEMRTFFRRTRTKAEHRLAGGAYLAVLTGYLDELRAMRSDPSAYRLLEHTLLSIIKEERYLHLAEDGRARELIAKLDDEVSVLYSRYMDFEHGGQVR
ncbi:hypothetical protein [Ruania zhangjianzhongii]|uniref:hypothetical protein n=1 Tax=Ruania zhangjianzhongii TaxID=2603206 RepID=UPI0011CC110F|nr:hypothetical protein [Ruania zhangjianzhongii]